MTRTGYAIPQSSEPVCLPVVGPGPGASRVGLRPRPGGPERLADHACFHLEHALRGDRGKRSCAEAAGRRGTRPPAAATAALEPRARAATRCSRPRCRSSPRTSGSAAASTETWTRHRLLSCPSESWSQSYLLWLSTSRLSLFPAVGLGLPLSTHASSPLGVVDRSIEGIARSCLGQRSSRLPDQPRNNAAHS
jgi:hypothetical protein